jgi:DNA transposition AAA+ family ATPase
MMNKSPETLTDQLRRAVDESGMGRNALARAAGIDKAAMSRFMAGKVGLLQSNLDALAAVLGLQLVKGPDPQADKPKAAPGRRGRKPKA